jgi:hypothetical protein
MTKRGNGQGPVHLRGHGRWEAQIRLAGGRRKSPMGRPGARWSGGSAKCAVYLLRALLSTGFEGAGLNPPFSRQTNRADIHLAFLQLGFTLIALRFLGEPRPTRENGRPGRAALQYLGT